MKKRQTSEIGTTSLQGTKAISPRCPYLGGSTVHHGSFQDISMQVVQPLGQLYTSAVIIKENLVTAEAHIIYS